MVLAKATLDDPSTWHMFADLDPEFLQMVNSNEDSNPFRGDSNLALSELRAKRDRYFRGKTDTLLKETADVSEEEIFIPIRDGCRVRALVYRPISGSVKERPVVVIIHGGGFRIGNAEMESPLCIGATKAYGCISISLEHRLSPEHKFPTAYEDCWDAILWLVKNASSLGADLLNGFILGGTSAGAHIANALSHRARDEKIHPPISGVYLNAPPLVAPQALPEKYRSMYRSREDLKDGYTLTSKSIALYDEEMKPDFHSPLWSPLIWPGGHANMPRTAFQVCGADLLRDEALIYERELRVENGIDTRIVVYQGLPHVFWYTHPSHSASKKFGEDAISSIGWLLEQEAE